MATYPGILSKGTYDREIPSLSGLVSAPGPYLEFGEFIYLEASSTDASATLRVSGKFLSTDNEIRAFTEDMIITGTGTQTAVVSRIGPCWLMGFSVRVVSGTITDGEIVASVHVARAGASNPVHVMTLASGEVTNTRSLGLGAFTVYSPGPTTVSVAPETPAVYSGSAPAAGAQWSVTVPAGHTWKVYGVRAQLTTSGVAGNRIVGLTFSDGIATYIAFYSPTVVAPGNSPTINFNLTRAEYAPFGYANSNISPFPMFLAAGYIITSSVTTMDAADQWGAQKVSYSDFTV